MHIVLAGGSGQVGTLLARAFHAEGHASEQRRICMQANSGFTTFVPGMPVAQFVELCWYCQDDHVVLDNREKVLPNGCVEIIINLGARPITVYGAENDARPQIDGDLLISGLHTTSFVIGSSSRGAALGICFKPGGAYAILGFPVDELKDKHINLFDIWPSVTEELQQRLWETPERTARFRIIEHWLAQRISADHMLHPAVAYALGEFQRQAGATTIQNLTTQVGLSKKRLIDLFRSQVGLTPKQYLRVQRFQQALSHIHRADAIAWADLALTYGYYDQAHFIHDFRALAGVTPAAYRAAAPAEMNHLPIIMDGQSD
jgi:AraC-like DNA-binding protein